MFIVFHSNLGDVWYFSRSLSCEEFLTVSPRAEENLFGYSDSDVDNVSVDSVEDKYDSSSDGSSSESGTDNSSGQNSADLIPQLSPRKQDAAINALIEPDEVDEEHTISSSKMAKRYSTYCCCYYDHVLKHFSYFMTGVP